MLPKVLFYGATPKREEVELLKPKWFKEVDLSWRIALGYSLVFEVAEASQSYQTHQLWEQHDEKDLSQVTLDRKWNAKHACSYFAAHFALRLGVFLKCYLSVCTSLYKFNSNQQRGAPLGVWKVIIFTQTQTRTECLSLTAQTSDLHGREVPITNKKTPCKCLCICKYVLKENDDSTMTEKKRDNLP